MPSTYIVMLPVVAPVALMTALNSCQATERLGAAASMGKNAPEASEPSVPSGSMPRTRP